MVRHYCRVCKDEVFRSTDGFGVPKWEHRFPRSHYHTIVVVERDDDGRLFTKGTVSFLLAAVTVVGLMYWSVYCLVH